MSNGYVRRLLLVRGQIILLVLFLFVSGCKSQNEPIGNENASSDIIVSATPPFKTKEPDRYRATRITTTQHANGETHVTRVFIARDGEMRRHESGTGTVYLELPNARFVLLTGEKVYVDITSTPEIAPTEEDITPEWIVHSAEAGTTSYQKLGMEVVGGRNAEKYRITVNTPTSGSVIVSETLLWIDEALQMPVRSEMKGSDGTRLTTELTDLSLDVDNRVFQVPEDYQKITHNDFIERLRNQ